MGRARVWLESGQAREVECDCLRAAGADGRNRRGANEPRGFGEDRGPEGGAAAGGLGSGVRRVLSVSGWRGGGGEERGHGVYKARRVSQGWGSDRGGGPVGGGDGVYRSEALPALGIHSSKPVMAMAAPATRSEERRVGKECRSRWS